MAARRPARRAARACPSARSAPRRWSANSPCGSPPTCPPAPARRQAAARPWASCSRPSRSWRTATARRPSATCKRVGTPTLVADQVYHARRRARRSRRPTGARSTCRRCPGAFRSTAASAQRRARRRAARPSAARPRLARREPGGRGVRRAACRPGGDARQRHPPDRDSPAPARFGSPSTACRRSISGFFERAKRLLTRAGQSPVPRAARSLPRPHARTAGLALERCPRTGIPCRRICSSSWRARPCAAPWKRIAGQAEVLAGEIELGGISDRGGPEALRLLAAVVRLSARDPKAAGGTA